MDLTITDCQCVTLHVAGRDCAGNLQPIMDVPTWQTSDSVIIAIFPESDGLSCKCCAVGPLGAAQVTVSDGTFTDVCNITVVEGDLAAVTLTADTPIDK